MPDKAKSTIKLIKRLSAAVGVAGYAGDNNIQDLVKTELTPLVDDIKQDHLGSVTGVKWGDQAPSDDNRRKLMIAAHLDEIGAMVTKIDDGFIRFERVGGLDYRLLQGQEVMVHGRRDLLGIIGSTPPHLLPLNEHTDEINITKMVIDVGLSTNQLQPLVEVGDLISFVKPATEMKNGLVSGKAMDNRASVAAMIVCLQELAKLRCEWDVYAVATAAEEIGGYLGASSQAYTIQPDVAVVIDVTFADVAEFDIKLGGGPVLTLGPSNHPVLRKRLVELCQDWGWSFQTETMTSGLGTDAYAIEVSREGVPTILISVPSRYMHSPIEMVDPKDIEQIGRLLALFIASLDEAFVTSLVPA